MTREGLLVGGAHPTECRLIIDEPAPGDWNMAVDEALLLDAAENGIASLRFYGWSEPTLSLGYFQRYQEREQHSASRASALVRRQTGGGAILHDRELTYSLTLPSNHSLARRPECLYQLVHEAFISALSELPEFAPAVAIVSIRGHDTTVASEREPFLCFQRRSPGDVTLTTSITNLSESGQQSSQSHCWKILGSAQRRYRGAVLQHGSLLLNRSPGAPELPGWSDLTGLTVESGQLCRNLSRKLAASLGLFLADATLPSKLKSKAADLANNKYKSATWTNRR